MLFPLVYGNFKMHRSAQVIEVLGLNDLLLLPMPPLDMHLLRAEFPSSTSVYLSVVSLFCIVALWLGMIGIHCALWCAACTSMYMSVADLFCLIVSWFGMFDIHCALWCCQFAYLFSAFWSDVAWLVMVVTGCLRALVALMPPIRPLSQHP